MLLGKNTNVRHGGVVFHVQTEDSGRARPHVITHLYHHGTILSSEKQSYAELVRRPDLEERVRELMDEQHERMLGKLRSGELDGLLHERLGSGFAGGAVAIPSPRREPAPAARREPARPAPPPQREVTLAEPVEDPIAEAALAVGRLGDSTPTPVPATPTPPPAVRAEPARSAPPSPATAAVRGRRDLSRETTVPEPTPRTFGDGIITDKPLDEVILAYLVEKARHRKRLPK